MAAVDLNRYPGAGFNSSLCVEERTLSFRSWSGLSLRADAFYLLDGKGIAGQLKKTRRETAILLVFLVILILFSALLVYLGITLIPSIAGIVSSAPEYTTTALHRISDLVAFIHNLFPAESYPQVDAFLHEAGTVMGNAVKNTFINGLSWIPNNMSLIIGLAALPVFLFYTLRDWTKLRTGLYSGPPA